MKSTGIFFSSFIMIAAGIVLCLLNRTTDVLISIVEVAGWAFLAAGVINVVIMLMRGKRKEDSSVMHIVGWVSGIGGLCLGLALILSPETFTSSLVYFFGGLLALGGLFQVIMLAWGFRPCSFAGWTYIMPVIEIIGGAVLLCSENVRANDSMMVLITGIGFILFGTTWIIALFYAARMKHLARKAGREKARQPQTAAVETAKPEAAKPATPSAPAAGQTVPAPEAGTAAKPD